MNDGDELLADWLDREIERVNSVSANSRDTFRKNVHAHIANWRAVHESAPAEIVAVIEDANARCEALAAQLDRQGLRHDDDRTRSLREAARLSVQRIRDAFQLWGF